MATNESDRDDTARPGPADATSGTTDGRPRHAGWEQRLSEARLRRAEVLQNRMDAARRESANAADAPPAADTATPRQPSRTAPGAAGAARDRPLTLAAAQAGRIRAQGTARPGPLPETAAPEPEPQRRRAGLATAAGIVMVLIFAVGFGAIVLLRGPEETMAGIPGIGTGENDGATVAATPPAGATDASRDEMPAWPEQAGRSSGAAATGAPVASASGTLAIADWVPPRSDSPPAMHARSAAPVEVASPSPPSAIAPAPPAASGPADPPVSPTAGETGSPQAPPAPQTAPAPPQRP